MFFVGQPFRVAYSKAEVLPYANLYFAFTIDETKKYIENQEKHHSKESFRDEYLKFLRKNNVDFDEKYM